ncbi:hypothetical protein LTR17_010279 [Elasticomyces elasticus]|nr:hypothetical protein LTR17_010279 [Elasticomyces elasticus]
MADLDSLKQEYGAALPPSLRPGATGRVLSLRTTPALSESGAAHGSQIPQNVRRSSTLTIGAKPGHDRPPPVAPREALREGSNGLLMRRTSMAPHPDPDKGKNAIFVGCHSQVSRHVDHKAEAPDDPARITSVPWELGERASWAVGTMMSLHKQGAGAAQSKNEVYDIVTAQPLLATDGYVQAGEPASSQSVWMPEEPSNKVNLAIVESNAETKALSAEQPIADEGSRGPKPTLENGQSMSYKPPEDPPWPKSVQSWHDEGVASAPESDAMRAWYKEKARRMAKQAGPKHIPPSEGLRVLSPEEVDPLVHKSYPTPQTDRHIDGADKPETKFPVSTTVRLDRIDVETLHHYNLPYQIDPSDTGQITIGRELSKLEQDALFEHTRRRRGDSPELLELDNNFDVTHVLEVDGHVVWQPVLEKFWCEIVPRSKNAMSCMDITFDTAWHHRRDQAWKNLTRLVDLYDHPPSGKLNKHLRLERLAAGEATSTLKCVVHSSFSEAKDRGASTEKTPCFRTLESFNTPPKAALFFVKHIHQESLNFELFKAHIMALDELQDLRLTVETHLTQDWIPEDDAVRSSGRMQVRNRPSEDRDSTITAASLSFVYSHTLARSPRTSSGNIGAQTLFQFLYPKGDRRQDLNQALCNMPGTRNERILCTTQLWAIIINEDILITCATMSEAELYGTLLSPIPQPAIGQNPPDVADLRVTSPDGKLWLLKRSNCRSFLEFISHFSDVSLSFCDDFTIYLDGEVVSPREWSRAIRAYDDPIIHLELRRNARGMIRQRVEDNTQYIERLYGEQYEAPRNAVLREVVKGLDLRPSPPPQSQSDHPNTGSTVSPRARRILTTVIEGLIESLSYITSPTKCMPDLPVVDHDSSKKRTVLPRVNAKDFNSRLKAWAGNVATQSEPFTQLDATTEQQKTDVLFLSPGECGYADKDAESHTDADAEPHDGGRRLMPMEMHMARCDLIYVQVFNGLMKVLGIFQDRSGVSGIPIEEVPELLGVVFHFTTALNDMLFPRPKSWSADILLRVWSCLYGLLRAGLLLEPYGFTWQHMPSERAYEIFSRFLLDLSRLTTLMQDLDFLYGRPNARQPSETVGSALYRLTTELRRLKSRGYCESSEWQVRTDSFTTLVIQETDGSAGPCNSIFMAWEALYEMTLSMDRNTRQLTSTFETHLLSTTVPLATTAAAKASDLLTTLLQQVTHLRVFQGGDAQRLYLNYMTELENKIATGEPSRQASERLRYLKYELNAISQLQTAQRVTLDQYYAHVQPDFAKPDDAEPGWEAAVPNKSFERSAWLLYSLIEQLRKENNVIQLLDGNIQPLQDEVSEFEHPTRSSRRANHRAVSSSAEQQGRLEE